MWLLNYAYADWYQASLISSDSTPLGPTSRHACHRGNPTRQAVARHFFRLMIAAYLSLLRFSSMLDGQRSTREIPVWSFVTLPQA